MSAIRFVQQTALRFQIEMRRLFNFIDIANQTANEKDSNLPARHIRLVPSAVAKISQMGSTL